ncbi:hypothetical protein CEXT_72441 [Caerostris extrusa]|uniref:Uncharacterized protein n=1 Tax=Caerostris extrusa TaxID=172846 RepID=A0AAV4M501_CAEEX|nr:hypothetical protein CEXT_72441 [Caerostris extrusa]
MFCVAQKEPLLCRSPAERGDVMGKNLQRKLNSPASHCFNLLFAVGIVTGQALEMRGSEREKKKRLFQHRGRRGRIRRMGTFCQLLLTVGRSGLFKNRLDKLQSYLRISADSNEQRVFVQDESRNAQRNMKRHSILSVTAAK